jgi:hypothetical protein
VSALTEAQVSTALDDIWGNQSCDPKWRGRWEESVRDALFSDGPAAVRHSLKPRFDRAVAVITAACADRIPADIERVIYREFPMLDATHRRALAERLRAEAAA